MTDSEHTPGVNVSTASAEQRVADNTEARSLLSVPPGDVPAVEKLTDRMQGSGDSFFFGKDVRSREGAQAAVLELLEWAERVNVTVEIGKKPVTPIHESTPKPNLTKPTPKD